MIVQYKTVYKGGSGEIVEKKSRFIAYVEPVLTEEEALSFIERTKKKNWDATHNCYAYRIGVERELKRFSDDGEPGGTAGKPMLDVLEGMELQNVCVVVTRYFGGTLLGTGGLVRAYQKATQAGISGSIVIEKRLAVELHVFCDYNQIGKIQYLCRQNSIPILDTEYTDTVLLTLLIPIEQYQSIKRQLTQATNAKATMEERRQVYFAGLDNQTLVFPAQGNQLER